MPTFGYLLWNQPVDDPDTLRQVEEYYAEQMRGTGFKGATEEFIEEQKREYEMHVQERQSKQIDEY